MTKKKLNLAELIKKVQAKESGAFEELYERYYRLVYYVAYKHCMSDADSKDIVQETFIEVQRSIHTLQNPDAFKFWLNRITLSKSLNLFRKNKYKLMDDEQLDTKNQMIEQREYMLPEKDARKRNDKDVLANMIDTLPVGQRQVLVLFYLEQFSIHEVADLLKLSEGTVKSRLSYARETLRKKIELYERTNDIKLNFHSLGEVLTATMLAEVATIEIPKVVLALTFVPKKWISSFQSFATTAIGKAALVSVCLGGASIGGVYALQEWNQDALPNHLLQKETEVTIQEETPFPEIEVLGKKIDTAKAAYFNIRYVACCEEEIKDLSPQQLLDIKTIYTTLKDVNSPYYQSLLDEGWLTSFESIANSN